MKLSYGVFDESYKLTLDVREQVLASLEKAPRTLHVTVGRGDFMPFTVLLSLPSAFSVQLGDSAWFTERGAVPTVRVKADIPIAFDVYHEQMHKEHRIGTLYADALLPTDAKEYGYGDIGAVCFLLKTDKRTAPGSYRGNVRFYTSTLMEREELAGEIEIVVDVLDVTVRSGQENRFYLDLWQHPSNIARHADVRLWSEEHFSVMEGYLRSLSALGQRALTLMVSEIPWSGQGCANYPTSGNNIYEFSIVPITKRTDGRFFYDFSVMQRYIDLAYTCGIREELSLYGLINVWSSHLFPKLAEEYPDGIRVRYLDEASGCYDYMRTAEELDGYIRALERYFIETKQIDRVRVAADEPGNVDAFRLSLNHLHEVAPAFKFKTAILHTEFIDEFGENFYDFAPYLHCTRDKLKQLREYKRTMPGKRFIWYSCCGPDRPNYFLRSSLVESYLVGILTSAYEMDGYLRWSYTVWTRDPMHDLAYNNWETGDMNLVYPGANGKPILSLRYFALKRGIQFYELLRSYRRRFGKVRMMELIAPLFESDDVKNFDTTYTTSYEAYNTLRCKLLHALCT